MRILRGITILATVFAIFAGTIMVSASLFLFFIGFVLGPIFLSPLFVTLLLSIRLSGVGTQVLLLCSTISYFAYFAYLFYSGTRPNGSFNLAALMCSLPIMIGFWIVAIKMRRRVGGQLEGQDGKQ